MNKERFRPYAAVFLFLIKDDKILLQRRFNTGYMDGNYTLVSGHIEKDEIPTEAMLREVREEAGTDLVLQNIECIQVMYRSSPEPDDREPRTYVDFFFISKNWSGEPKIAEPDRCDDLSWFSLNKLPDNILSFIRKAIENYKNNISYSEFS